MARVHKSRVVTLLALLFNLGFVQCSHFNGSLESSKNAQANSFNIKNVDRSLGSTDSSVASNLSGFYTNDHEHLDKIGLSHHNSVRNSFSSGGNEAASSPKGESVNDGRRRSGGSSAPILNANSKLELSAYQQHQPIRHELQNKQQLPIWQYNQPQANFDVKQLQPQRTAQVGRENGKSQIASQSPGNWTDKAFIQTPAKYEARKDTPTNVVYSRPLNTNGMYGQYQYGQRQQARPFVAGGRAPTYKTVKAGYNTASKSGQKRRKNPKRKILSNRADTYAVEGEEEDEEAEDETEGDEGDTANDYRYGTYQTAGGEGDDENDGGDGGDNGFFFPHDGSFPETKDFGFPGGPGGPPPIGPPGGPPEPLPPPPPPLKGSADYILIPIILIGLAGPIFVVLYVILGGFEYKLAPIARNLKGYTANYQPYIDTVTNSVGRALEKYECYEYASCRALDFYSKMGFSSDTNSAIEEAVTNVTPEEYKSTMKKVFRSLKHPETQCQKYQCSDMVDYFL